MKNFLKPIKRENDIDLKEIIKKSKGLTPSDIKMIVIDAFKISIIDSHNMLTQKDINTALNKFLSRENVRKKSLG